MGVCLLETSTVALTRPVGFLTSMSHARIITATVGVPIEDGDRVKLTLTLT